MHEEFNPNRIASGFGVLLVLLVLFDNFTTTSFFASIGVNVLEGSIMIFLNILRVVVLISVFAAVLFYMFNDYRITMVSTALGSIAYYLLKRAELISALIWEDIFISFLLFLLFMIVFRIMSEFE